MENESKIMLDENAGIMIDDGKINAVAFLFDAQYKEFAERTNTLRLPLKSFWKTATHFLICTSIFRRTVKCLQH